MAKKASRKVVISVTKHAIDNAMAKMGYKVGSVGGGTIEYEGKTLLSNKKIIKAIAQKIANEVDIILE